MWQQVAASTAPLRPAAAGGDEAAAPPLPAPKSLKPITNRLISPKVPEPPRISYDLVPDPHRALETAVPHMDRRRFDTLRRGRMEPEARLDLHGMTSERAHAALIGFVVSAHANGLRLVLVITGKGKASDDGYQPKRHGILRHSLPHWLAGAPLGPRVLQVTGAHRKHGGEGAFYVYLRRQR